MRGTEESGANSLDLYRITPACAGNSIIFCKSTGNIRDHPRVCGEQYLLAYFGWLLSGSPPRVRGTALVVSCRTPRAGITPACAGNSAMAYMFNVSAEDHPRVCGEQQNGVDIGGQRLGSPPRVRGTGRWEL